MADEGQRLPRLIRQQKYFHPDGTPTVKMQTDWQDVMQRIEALVERIETLENP